MSIIVPCHRVVGSDGSLTGYDGGLGNKRRLLELEQVSPGPGGQAGAGAAPGDQLPPIPRQVSRDG